MQPVVVWIQRLQFVLAQRDPNGGITTGITRTQSHFGFNMNMGNEDFRMKNLIGWDPLKYINVWLVNNIIGEIGAGFSCGVWNEKTGGWICKHAGQQYLLITKRWYCCSRFWHCDGA
jgi:hypothetical protein